MVLLPSRSKLLPVLKGRLLLVCQHYPTGASRWRFRCAANTYEHSRCCALWSDWYLHLYQTCLAFKMGFSAVVPRTGLVRTVVRYFDSIAFTHSLIPIRGYRSRYVVVTDYRLRTTQRWLIFLYRISFLRCIIKSA